MGPEIVRPSLPGDLTNVALRAHRARRAHFRGPPAAVADSFLATRKSTRGREKYTELIGKHDLLSFESKPSTCL